MLLYLCLLTTMLLFSYHSPIGGFSGSRGVYRSLNLIPFRTISLYLHSGYAKTAALHNVWGNIAVFVPMGIYLALLQKNKGGVLSLLLAGLISMSFEALQYILMRGASDVDDVLLNTFGALIVIAGYKCLAFVLHGEEKARTVVTVLAAVVGLPFFVYLALHLL